MKTELEAIKAQRPTTKKTYTTKTINLLRPIGDIHSVTVRAPTLFEDTELTEDGERNEAELVALVAGLTLDDVDKLSQPDWNDIVSALNEFLSKTSYKLARKRYVPKDMRITLLFTESEQVIDFSMPTVAITRRGKKIKDTTDRLKFYLAQLTDLSKDEIENMPLPDYSMLDQVVSDFLFREADYFQ